MINEALRLMRVFHDFKAIEMAEKLGISAGYLSEIESGKKKPTIDILTKYSEILETPISNILFFSEVDDKNGNESSIKKSIRKKIINFLHSIENEK